MIQYQEELIIFKLSLHPRPRVNFEIQRYVNFGFGLCAEASETNAISSSGQSSSYSSNSSSSSRNLSNLSSPPSTSPRPLMLPTFALLHPLPPNPPLHDDCRKIGGPPGRLATHKRPDIGCKTLPRNSPKGSSCRSGCQPLAATSETLPMSCKD